MNGLIYSLDDDTDNTPVFWLGIALVALMVHAIPLFYFRFPAWEPPPEDNSVTVTLDDSFLNSLDAALAPKATEKEAAAQFKPLVPAPVAAASAVAVPIPPEAPKPDIQKVQPPPEPVAEAIPVPKAQPKPLAAPPPLAKVEEPEKAKPKLKDTDLPSLTHARIDVAFDENKNTNDKKVLTDTYLSDRNSTAADRGAKNLKTGDPFIDQGNTNVIRYMGKRGEGNVTALDSSPLAGSIKKEGAPIEGDGGAKHVPDFSHSVEVKPQPALPKKEDAKVAEVQREARLVPPVEPPKLIEIPRPHVADAKPVEADPQTVEVGSRAAKLKTAEQEAGPKNELVRSAPKFKPQEPVFNQQTTLPPTPATSTVAARPASEGVAEGTSIDKSAAELDQFVAELNGFKRTEAAGDGTTGNGPRMRKGEKGHEGNGTYRPGDDNAVSDVTTINLESSATEFGDPRFAKTFDAKTAYIKSFARHIDRSWKAELHARLRARLVPGMVSIRVILRRDGKLMEASESYRNRGIPDEYVSTAKHAIEDAADPSADPFPPALAGRETIEYTFTFLYQ